MPQHPPQSTAPHTPSAAPPGPWGARALAAILLAAALVTVAAPAIAAALDFASLPPDAAKTTEMAPFTWGALLNTLLVSSLVGALATALSLPAAWTLRRASPVWVALLCIPLLLPMYLAYTGWGLLRSPGTWLGDWVGHGDPRRATQVNFTLAIGGLTLWSTPIAAMLVGAAARRLPAPVLEALALEPASRPARWAQILRMLAPDLGVAVGLIALITAGSAVPLHLAQLNTYAIGLWKYLTLAPHPATVWPAATPLLLAMLAAAAWVVRLVMAERPGAAAADDPGVLPIGPATRLAAAAVWTLGVVAPLGLFAWALKSWSSLGEFWAQRRGAVGSSVEIGLIVGAAVGGLCVCTWAALACLRGGGDRVVRLAAVLMAFGALAPGILVGHATLALWNAPWMPRWIGDTAAPLVLAHVARFGFLGVALGVALARSETPDERGARLLAAGPGVRGFVALLLRPALGPVAGVSLAGAALSVHEIESAVFLQPPGREGLAQRLLDLLHYARDEQLAAGCICLLAGGVVVALVAGILLAPSSKSAVRGERPPGP